MIEISLYELEFGHRYAAHVTTARGYADAKAGKPFWFPHGEEKELPNLYIAYKAGYDSFKEING